MFVSSYSTYIHAKTPDKVAKQQNERVDFDAKSFPKLLSKELPSTSLKTQNLPIDYISKNTVLHNKQELDKQQNKSSQTIETAKSTLLKFTGQNTLINAQSAYTSNAKMFSLFKLPNTPLNQTVSLENTLPKEPREIKEFNMRQTMVNTYTANDNYYKVTAA